jgi:DNA-directed RNA polymerase specialized sigma24 family protein
MATDAGDSRERARKARFDAFFDFYFPRVHAWLLARTRDRESAERLTEVVLERALDRFDRGEPAQHAAWMLRVSGRALVASGRGGAADSTPGWVSGGRRDRSTR